MSQADYDVANASGATVRGDINAHLDAIVTNNGGASAPSTTFANMWWFDESNDILKQRNKANSAWINVAQKDGSGWRSYWNGSQLDTVFQGLDATLTSLAAVAGVAGDILYASGTDTWARLAKDTNGMFLKQASGLPAWATIITRETAIATTSGTSHGWTGINAGANRITFMFDSVSLIGTDRILLQIGDSAGYETSDYLSGASWGTTSFISTTGFALHEDNNATSIYSGVVILARLDGNTWSQAGNLTRGAATEVSAGRKTLSDELTRVKITRIGGGGDTFDGGKINIFTE